MFRFILVLGVLFLPKVETLKCYECEQYSSGTCADKITECPSQNYQCLSTRLVTLEGGTKIIDVKAKGCAMTEQCLEGSINFGVVRSVQKTTCCTTELCNIQTPDYKSNPNGKKCFTCEGQNCTRTLNCLGDENNCITVTANVGDGSQKATLKGCASQVMCSDKITTLLQQLTGVEFDCCQGNYCNGASSASPARLLLVPLFFSVLF